MTNYNCNILSLQVVIDFFSYHGMLHVGMCVAQGRVIVQPVSLVATVELVCLLTNNIE